MSFSLRIAAIAIVVLFSTGAGAQQSVKMKKTSLAEIGQQGIDNLKRVAAGYGTKICKEKIKTKEDITKIAWTQIRHNCGKFTFGMMKNFRDEPSVLYSLCIFSALEVCQKKVGISKPCDTVESCQAQLGVPREGE